MTHTDDTLVDGTSLDDFIAEERTRDPEFAAEWDKNALTEAVAKAINAYHREISPHSYDEWEHESERYKSQTRGEARAALAAVRAHDEQAALNCGHCTPNTDEIACACTIKERDDE